MERRVHLPPTSRVLSKMSFDSSFVSKAPELVRFKFPKVRSSGFWPTTSAFHLASPVRNSGKDNLVTSSPGNSFWKKSSDHFSSLALTVECCYCPIILAIVLDKRGSSLNVLKETYPAVDEVELDRDLVAGSDREGGGVEELGGPARVQNPG